MSGSGTPLTQAARENLVRIVQNEELCVWFENASVVDKLAYLAEHEPPTPWHRASGTRSTVNYYTKEAT